MIHLAIFDLRTVSGERKTQPEFALLFDDQRFGGAREFGQFFALAPEVAELRARPLNPLRGLALKLRPFLTGYTAQSLGLPPNPDVAIGILARFIDSFALADALTQI
jgi:hypothetical protein